MHDTIIGSSEDGNATLRSIDCVNEAIKPQYTTYNDLTTIKSYVNSICASSINSNTTTVEIDDIVTYSALEDEGDINKMYKLIFTAFCKNYPEKENEYKTLLKLYFMDYRRTVIAIETQNFKQIAENGFTS